MQRADGDERPAGSQKRRGAFGHHRVAALEQVADEFVFRRAFGRARSLNGVGDGQNFGWPAFAVESQHGRVEVVVDARIAGGGGEQRRGGFWAQGGDGVELLADRFEAYDLHPRFFRGQGQELVDLRQIAGFARRFAGGRRGQHGQEPRLQMVREFGRVSEAPDEGVDLLAIFGRDDALERVTVAIERLGQRRRGDVGLVDEVERPAELGRQDLRSPDRLRGAPCDFERRLVGRVDRAEEKGGGKAGFGDAPQKAVSVDEIVRPRGLSRCESLNLGKVRALTGLGRPGSCEGKEGAEKARTRANTNDPHSFLSATSSIRWLAPLVKSKSARGRVGRIFSCRLTRLMRRQIERPVASASASSRSAYWRK